MTKGSRMSVIMDLIFPAQLELCAFELENIAVFDLFTLYHLQISTNQH